MECWLTGSDHSRKESQRLIEQVTAYIRKRLDNQYAELRPDWMIAAHELQKQWFQVSIGLDFEGERETLFLTDVKNAYLVGEDSIFSFTHWLGTLFAELREAALKGKYPTELPYGPPLKDGRPPTSPRPVGPFCLYRIVNGRISSVDFHSVDAIPTPPPALGVPVTPDTARAALRPIWLTIDPSQDRNFRWPFHGEYILTGGPGTGKTSVALLRIPFLTQQQRNEEMAGLMPPGYRRTEDFFTEESMLVVVWEPHLEPYLQDSLRELSYGDVPVQFYDRWLNDQLRHFLPLGGDYRIQPDDDNLDAVKHRLSEADLGAWVSSWWDEKEPFCHPRARDAYRALQEWIGDVRKRFGLTGNTADATETWEVLRTPLDRTRFQYSQQGLAAVEKSIRDELQQLSYKCARPEPNPRAVTATKEKKPNTEQPVQKSQRRERLRSAIAGLLDELRQLCGRLAAEVSDRYATLLLDFYLWACETRQEAVAPSKAERDRVIEKIRTRIQQKRISRFDRVLILWLVQLTAEKSAGAGISHDVLPSFSHILVDEAQQYDPLVLRLFRRLARPPFNSITLVGDLRQRLREDGGVVIWDDLGMPIPEERRRELRVNYRWARRTFEALSGLSKALGFDVVLQPPLRWPAGDGIPAAAFFAGDTQAEMEDVAQRISQLLAKPEAEHWSIAILLPSSYLPEKDALISMLDGRAINSRWAESADVRAGREGVTLTNASSIVGLEFDAVYILGAQEFLPQNPTEIQRQTFWVMATRARQHLFISAARPLKLLEEWMHHVSR